MVSRPSLSDQGFAFPQSINYGTVDVGLAVGLIAGLAVGRVVLSLLYGVSSFDALTFITVPLVLLCVACLAILVPARKAVKVDPMVALRYE